MKSKIVNIPIYEVELEFIKTKDIISVASDMGFNVSGNVTAFAASNSSSDKEPLFRIVLSKKADQGVIAHECLHIVGMLYEYIGAKLDEVNDEPQCYLLQFLVDECNKFLKGR